MLCRTLKAAALVAVCASVLSARPAGAQGCTPAVPATCAAGLQNITGFGGLPTGGFTTTAAALDAAIAMVVDLQDARFEEEDQPIFQSGFVGECLEQDIRALRAMPRTTATQLEDFCQEVAQLRASLTARRRDGTINNCYFRLTCGFTSQGFLLRCDENVRHCLTEFLDELLRCAAVLAGCTGVRA